MAKIIVTNAGGLFREYPLEEVKRTECAEERPRAVLTDELGQTMLGFGMALTDAACIMIRRLPEEEQKKLMHEVFSPAEMNFSVGRICVGASDYADEVYHFAPREDDMEMEAFDASHDDRDILPVLQMAQKENPDLFLFSSPWSPPGWMKTSRIMQGGWMREKYLDAYVRYYLKFIQYYEQKGIRIQAMTTQNETETDQVSRMPACLWHPELEAAFVKKMRKALDETGYKDLKIWLTDHNFNLWRRPFYQLEDEELRSAASGIAWHPYEGHPEVMEWIQRKYPDTEQHWTEGSVICDLYGGINASMPHLTYADYARGFIRAIESGMQSITLWNLALDENGYPNVGPFGCKGAIKISSDGRQVTRSMDYYTLAHFSRYIGRGARRILLKKEQIPANFEVAAFENPDGTVAAVVSNTDFYDSPLDFSFRRKEYSAWIRRESVSVVVFD